MKNSEKLIKHWDGELDPKKHVGILLWDRMTGKTTECISYLEAHPNVYCIVPYLNIRNLIYPQHLRNRITSAGSQYRTQIPRGADIIIDEAAHIDDDILYDLYQNYNIRFVTFSPRTFLQTLMMHNGINTKVSEEYQTWAREAGLRMVIP